MLLESFVSILEGCHSKKASVQSIQSQAADQTGIRGGGVPQIRAWSPHFWLRPQVKGDGWTAKA